MSIFRLLSFVFYSLAILLSAAFAFMYLTRKQFMPYHSDAVKTPWEKVDKNFQALIKALLRVSGGGFLCMGVSMAFLLAIPYRAGEGWANPALLASGLSATVPTFIGTLIVKNNTPANPPWKISLIAIILVVLGFGMGLLH